VIRPVGVGESGACNTACETPPRPAIQIACAMWIEFKIRHGGAVEVPQGLD